MKSNPRIARSQIFLSALTTLLLSACAVTRVDTGFGLTGGPITRTGTIALDTSATDARYARLSAANTFNGNQTVNGTLTATVSTGSGANSFSLNSNMGTGAIEMKSNVGVGQVLHTYCTASPGTDCYGIWAEGTSTGGMFNGNSRGVVALAPTAGLFNGNVDVHGTLTKSAGAFKIDHPLDPGNKYLTHSLVESPDMMNIYNGIVTLNSRGEAWVSLPDWFEALNADFRYQLTAIGGPSPNLYIAMEISKSRFKIAGGRAGGKVSWQVTGIRHDAYAEAHRLKVEEAKAPEDRGHYLHPDLFKQPTEKSIFMRQIPRQTPMQSQ